MKAVHKHGEFEYMYVPVASALPSLVHERIQFFLIYILVLSHRLLFNFSYLVVICFRHTAKQDVSKCLYFYVFFVHSLWSIVG
jgi:hypothetical protein